MAITRNIILSALLFLFDSILLYLFLCFREPPVITAYNKNGRNHQTRAV
jgi:hypothetical protein